MTQQALDQTFAALADPTRRAILARLIEGETRVTDLAAPFDMSLNAVSKHVRVLERAGLVSRRVTGRDHLLTFNGKPLEEAASLIEHYRTFWTQRLDNLEAYLTRKGNRKDGK